MTNRIQTNEGKRTAASAFAAGHGFGTGGLRREISIVQASNGLADALLRLGDTNTALRWANHSVSVAPRDAAARVILGEVLFQKGDRNAAEVEWREALQLEPANFIAKLRLNRVRKTL